MVQYTCLCSVSGTITHSYYHVSQEVVTKSTALHVVTDCDFVHIQYFAPYIVLDVLVIIDSCKIDYYDQADDLIVRGNFTVLLTGTSLHSNFITAPTLYSLRLNWKCTDNAIQTCSRVRL